MSLVVDLVVFASKVAIVGLVAVIVLCAVGGFLVEMWGDR